MRGWLALVLHAHLPYVRHPEHQESVEERWLFEALTETYIPLLQVLQGWERDAIPGKITFSLTPTLCAMLRDKFLQERYRAYLQRLERLADLEAHRTAFERQLHEVALFYCEQLRSVSEFYEKNGGDMVDAFSRLQASGRLEIIACSATHAVLPLLRSNFKSLRAQVLIGRDQYVESFGRNPTGFWLPECAWAEGIDDFLAEAGVRWFVMETRGVMDATPKPRFGPFAPVITPAGVAAFGRDHVSARQVWSRDEGYPGDFNYRDFYRDIGFDLDLDYLSEFLPDKDRRSFTGIKYHRITGKEPKETYNRPRAVEKASEHAQHFLQSRSAQLAAVEKHFDHPIVVCPYDAELFGHWWYEGPEFIDALCRANAQQTTLDLRTPGDYLEAHPRHQLATPAESSWGEQGYWRVWLNETNHWIVAELARAQGKMEELSATSPSGDELRRAITQAARELMLAQSSDWAFIIRTGTSPEYAATRVKTHLSQFWRLCEQFESARIDLTLLKQLEAQDNLFEKIDVGYWAGRGTTKANALRSTQPRERDA